MTETQTPPVLFVKKPVSPVVHVGKQSHLRGHVVSACNGRTMFGFVVGTEMLPGSTLCQRCAAKVGVVMTGALTPLEFRPWAKIPCDRKRGTGAGREVLGETFLGEPTWLPWMGEVDGDE